MKKPLRVTLQAHSAFRSDSPRPDGRINAAASLTQKLGPARTIEVTSLEALEAACEAMAAEYCQPSAVWLWLPKGQRTPPHWDIVAQTLSTILRNPDAAVAS